MCALFIGVIFLIAMVLFFVDLFEWFFWIAICLVIVALINRLDRR